MRVLYLVNLYPKVSHTFVRREIEGVEAAGIDVERVALRRNDEPLVDDADRAELERTRVVLAEGAAGLLVAIALAVLRRRGTFLAALRTTLALSRRSSRGLTAHLAYLAEACVLDRWYPAGIDHVHAHFATNPATVALLWKELGGPGFSFTAHGTLDFEDPIGNSLSDKIHASAFVVAVSSYGRGQLLRFCREDDTNKLQLVHCGVGAEILDVEPPAMPRVKRLVSVARLSREKGLDVLLRALASDLVAPLAWELVLVGDGPERPRLERLARELGIEQRLSWPGYAAGPEVCEHLSDAQLFVLPSSSEGLPVVLMEALGLARPAIATYVAGIPELVRENENGWLVPCGDPTALAEAIHAALGADEVMLRDMGLRGRQRVALLHDARIEAARLAELFHAAASPTLSLVPSEAPPQAAAA